jgi:histidine triad (HIT) family protein
MTESGDTIFTKIIKGEIPCHKIYEDERVLAFLDISPYAAGHTLVISKEQTDQLWDLADELYTHLMNVVRKVANRQREILQPRRVGVVVEGFAVAHAHVHVFPMQVGLEGTIAQKPTQPSDDELKAMAERLRF